MTSQISVVALRKESVDRNSTRSASFRAYIVALRKESVDRNIVFCLWAWMGGVALRKESVDRNTSVVSSAGTIGKSLSARRAWIEITRYISSQRSRSVALRKESVDRNLVLASLTLWLLRSLSARRAWIEISICSHFVPYRTGRSPQGERG